MLITCLKLCFPQMKILSVYNCLTYPLNYKQSKINGYKGLSLFSTVSTIHTTNTTKKYIYLLKGESENEICR